MVGAVLNNSLGLVFGAGTKKEAQSLTSDPLAGSKPPETRLIGATQPALLVIEFVFSGCFRIRSFYLPRSNDYANPVNNRFRPIPYPLDDFNCTQ